MGDDSIPRLPREIIEKAPKVNLPRADRVAAAKKDTWTLFESTCYILDYEPLEPNPHQTKLLPLLTEKDETPTDLGIVYVHLNDTVRTNRIEPYSVVLWASVSGLPALGYPGVNCRYNQEEYLLQLRAELSTETPLDEEEFICSQDSEVLPILQAASHRSGTPLPDPRAPMDEYRKLFYDDDGTTTLFAYWFFRIYNAIKDGDLPATYDEDNTDLPIIANADLNEWVKGLTEIQVWNQRLSMSDQIMLERLYYKTRN